MNRCWKLDNETKEMLQHDLIKTPAEGTDGNKMSCEKFYRALKFNKPLECNILTFIFLSHCVFNLKLAKLNVRDDDTQVIRVSQ